MGVMPKPSPSVGGYARWRRDVVLAPAVLVPDLLFFSDIVTPEPTWPQRLLALGWCALGYIAIRLRTTAPGPAYGVAWCYATGAVVLSLLGVFAFTPFFALLVTLYTVAAERGRGPALRALAATVVPSALAVVDVAWLRASPGHHLSALIGSTVFYVVLTLETWMMARWSRNDRAVAERDRAQLARAQEAIRHERLLIARELHDILAHTVTVMVLQASGARHVLATDPARADDALSHVEEVGRNTMDELRRMLAVIRSSAPAREEYDQGGIADLDRLLDGLRRVGLHSRLQAEGAPAFVAESLSRTVYRIVREAVTNTVKHAGPGASVTVRLVWGSARLDVDVTDGGPPPQGREPTASLSTGNGLRGLAERVAVFGGTLTAGPCGEGFRVHAVLPLDPPPDEAGSEPVVSEAPGALPEARKKERSTHDPGRGGR